MKNTLRILIIALSCCFLFANNIFSQKDSIICVKIDDIGMYAPRGENSTPPYEFPSTAIAFYYNGKSFYLPILEDSIMPQFGVDLRDTVLLTIKTIKNRTGYYGEKPLVGISKIQRVKSAGVLDTICWLISFSDTVYVTDAEAHWTIDECHRECYGKSPKKQRHPIWILHIKSSLCERFSIQICQSADYYDRGNRRWIPLKRVKSVGHPLDVSLDSCQLMFQFQE